MSFLDKEGLFMKKVSSGLKDTVTSGDYKFLLDQKRLRGDLS